MIVWFLLLYLLPLAIFNQREKSAKKHVLSFLKAVFIETSPDSPG